MASGRKWPCSRLDECQLLWMLKSCTEPQADLDNDSGVDGFGFPHSDNVRSFASDGLYDRFRCEPGKVTSPLGARC